MTENPQITCRKCEGHKVYGRRTCDACGGTGVEERMKITGEPTKRRLDRPGRRPPSTK